MKCYKWPQKYDKILKVNNNNKAALFCVFTIAEVDFIGKRYIVDENSSSLNRSKCLTENWFLFFKYITSKT